MKLNRRDLVWIVPAGIAATFFGWFGWRTVKIQFLKSGPSAEPKWKDGERVRVARLEELDEVWAFKYFEYPLAAGRLPAALLRLPGPVPGGLSVEGRHYAAWSRICTHQGCTVDYVKNTEAGAILYNYRSNHPFFGCKCHFGAFDPVQAGRAVFGPPRFPLPRIRLEAELGVLYATGHETPLRPLESLRAAGGTRRA